jgi:hypothetical protein
MSECPQMTSTTRCEPSIRNWTTAELTWIADHEKAWHTRQDVMGNGKRVKRDWAQSAFLFKEHFGHARSEMALALKANELRVNEGIVTKSHSFWTTKELNWLAAHEAASWVEETAAVGSRPRRDWALTVLAFTEEFGHVRSAAALRTKASHLRREQLKLVATANAFFV